MIASLSFIISHSCVALRILCVVDIILGHFTEENADPGKSSVTLPS